MNLGLMIFIAAYYALLSFPCYNWCRMNSCHDENPVKQVMFGSDNLQT